jgi:tetratricopeptide (TPR) repeat protein
MDEKGRGLVKQQRWEKALHVSQAALARCDQTDWCHKDPRYQGLFHTTIGEAEESLGRRDVAIKHYRSAFYAYPLFFTENYFRLLKNTGQYRLLRREIDVKLANNEAAQRSASAFWLPSESSRCGRSFTGNYGWSLRMGQGRGARVSGKVFVSQAGCGVTADFASANEQSGATPLRLRADLGSGVAVLLYGPPCVTSDKGRLVPEKNGFAVSADGTGIAKGCPQGPFTIEFVRE